MTDVRSELKSAVDENYRRFHCNLIPGVDPETVLGVRMPDQRRIAKAVVRGDWRAYLELCALEYYEEKMIFGLVVAEAKMGTEERRSYIRRFAALIDNWAVCDCVVSSMKFIAEDRAAFFSLIREYLCSRREYDLRFAVVVLMTYYLTDEYIETVLELLDGVHSEFYYVRMAVAWAVSAAFVQYEQRTLAFLQNNHLDDFTYNKSLQKIIESLRVSKENKALMRSMKRK